MTMKLGIWRYDATTPREKRPWIVSFHEGDEVYADALDFETWEDARRFVSSGACFEYLGIDR